MDSFRFYLLFGIVCVCVALPATIYNPDEAFRTEFELSLYDLQDVFDERDEAVKAAYLKGNFEWKRREEKELGRAFKYTKRHLSTIGDVPEEIRSKWLLLNRPGDYALPEDAWNKFINFSNSLEQLHEIGSINNIPHSKQVLADTLENSRNLTTLREKWSAWQQIFSQQQQNDYASILQLLQNASEANEQLNVKTYWEMLSDYDDGFAVSQKLWYEIKPLYDKLRAFVRKRLYAYYNYSEEDVFPVYMSGTLLGDDWSNIADIILPRPYLFYDAKTFLHTKSSKQLYQHAETIANKLGFPRLSHKFWSSSTFNHTTCANLLLTFCEEKHTEVLTCSSNSWQQYLESHELILKAALREMEFDEYPLSELRGSIFDEAVVGLGSFLAINAMDRVGVVKLRDDDVGDAYQKQVTLLLLTALRVLPKLAFYYAADTWRLDENLGKNWGSYRQEIQGLKGQEFDYLNDEYIISNKPYLRLVFGERVGGCIATANKIILSLSSDWFKFLGIFLQFQIKEYFTSYYSETETLFDIITADATFYNAVKERLNNHWQDLIRNNFGIETISAQPLLDYFQPLNDYLDNVPTDFITQPPFTTQLPTTTTEFLKRAAFTTEILPADATATSEIVVADNGNETTTIKPLMKSKQSETLQQNAGMYIGLAVLAIVAVVVVVVLVRNRVKKRRKSNNNRRFET